MTDLDLDAIEARSEAAKDDRLAGLYLAVTEIDALVAAVREGREASAKATAWHMEALGDLASCVAERDEARDEARAEVRRLRERAEAHAVTVQQAVAVERQRDDARAEVERLALVVTSLTAMVEAKSSWIDGARIDIDGLEAERDDWRRRYEALRDGVTGLCDERENDPYRGVMFGGEPFPARVGTSDLRAVVARVEGDES
ncbi:MAG: hypothetical protein U0R76_10900 [Candidatus Nanopelagicales bacterium]